MVSLSSGQLITEKHPVLGRDFSAWEGLLLAFIANREAYQVIREAYIPIIDSMNKKTFAYGRYLKLFDLLETEEFRERTDQLIKKYGSEMPTIEGV